MHSVVFFYLGPICFSAFVFYYYFKTHKHKAAVSQKVPKIPDKWHLFRLVVLNKTSVAIQR